MSHSYLFFTPKLLKITVLQSLNERCWVLTTDVLKTTDNDHMIPVFCCSIQFEGEKKIKVTMHCTVNCKKFKYLLLFQIHAELLQCTPKTCCKIHFNMLEIKKVLNNFLIIQKCRNICTSEPDEGINKC